MIVNRQRRPDRAIRLFIDTPSATPPPFGPNAHQAFLGEANTGCLLAPETKLAEHESEIQRIGKLIHAHVCPSPHSHLLESKVIRQLDLHGMG
ncbi:hypothetical protein ACN8ZM_40600 (plasmid) [Burkholderia aenigmatica]|uniref:hypothetical protein n=1 Tax=Burkholderia aenigmatica TaxID=2015348 RepID=UPI003B43C770